MRLLLGNRLLLLLNILKMSREVFSLLESSVRISSFSSLIGFGSWMLIVSESGFFADALSEAMGPDNAQLLKEGGVICCIAGTDVDVAETWGARETAAG